jgi:hypothetical protein
VVRKLENQKKQKQKQKQESNQNKKDEKSQRGNLEYFSCK